MDAITLDWSDGIPADGEAQLFAALNQRCAEHETHGFTVNGHTFRLEQQHYGPSTGKYFWQNPDGYEGEYFEFREECYQDAIRFVREMDADEADRKDAIMEQARATGRRDVVRAAAVELWGEQGA